MTGRGGACRRDVIEDRRTMKKMVKPQEAICCYHQDIKVLCCSACGKCGQHSHEHCSPGGAPIGFAPMHEAKVSNCAGGDVLGVLCCTACGRCGNHSHKGCR